MGSDNEISRREFLKGSAAVAGGVALLGSDVLAQDQPAANLPTGRINVGVIGCGGMGNAHIHALQRLREAGYSVAVRAVCDVYKPRLDAAAERTGATPYTDYRELIARSDLHAVAIATPDHWHARMTIEAADAGKDIYCEKPMTNWHDLKEAQDVVQAISRNGRVMQVGTQHMSSSIWDQAHERISEGALGKLIHAQASDMRNGHIGLYDPNSNDGHADPSTNLDWDMWLGPAKKRPWQPGRFFAYRVFSDYSGGVATDFFPHVLTPLVRTMGVTFPKRVMGTGGLYQLRDGREAPDIFTITAEYPDGPSLLLVASVANNTRLPMIIRGYEGTMTLSLDRAVIDPQKPTVGDRPSEEIAAERGPSLDEHFRDFLDCVRSREKPRSNEILGYHVMTVLHMGMQSHFRGRAMEFDTDRGRARFV